jgi:hypothetical protein
MLRLARLMQDKAAVGPSRLSGRLQKVTAVEG